MFNWELDTEESRVQICREMIGLIVKPQPDCILKRSLWYNSFMVDYTSKYS